VLSSVLNNYVLSTALTTSLNNYVLNSALTTTLNNYVSNSALTTTLNNYSSLSGANIFTNDIIIKNQYINKILSLSGSTSYTISPTNLMSSYFVDNYTSNIIINLPNLNLISSGTQIHFLFNPNSTFEFYVQFNCISGQYINSDISYTGGNPFIVNKALSFTIVAVDDFNFYEVSGSNSISYINDNAVFKNSNNNFTGDNNTFNNSVNFITVPSCSSLPFYSDDLVNLNHLSNNYLSL
jgi:hypothetical protein